MSGWQRSRLLDALGLDHGFGTLASDEVIVERLHQAKQVHGTELLHSDYASASAGADALWTDAPEEAVGIRTADCVPILLADRAGRCVAAVHAGWKGSAAGIAGRVVQALESRGVVVDPSTLVAAVGPHIGPCCYEVDAPVRDAIAEASVFTPGRPGHHQLDLFALNRLQLLRAGLDAACIERVGECTSCRADLYPSYRRDRTSGRMLHWVRMPALP